MRNLTTCSLLLLVCAVFANQFTNTCQADVKHAEQQGFQIVIVRQCSGDPATCQNRFLKQVDQWWLSDHTYSGSSQNLSFDLDHRCLAEKLPEGGFIRHMEWTQFLPGKRIVLTGGMGPLQGMGLHGAMTFQWKATESGTQLELTYNVSGYSPDGLKELATIVDTVLSQQMDSFQTFCQPKE